MMFALASQFHIYVQLYILYLGGHLTWCLKSVLNVKALVGTFNQEKVQVEVLANLRLKL